MSQQYIVLHTMVEHWHRGQTITVEHLKSGQDREIDIHRLLTLGAIAPVGSGAAQAVLDELGHDAVTPEGTSIHDEVPLPPLDIMHPNHPQYTPPPNPPTTRASKAAKE